MGFMARFDFHKSGEDNSFLKHHYPDDKLYHKGVVATTTMLERKNPTVKKWNPHLHSKTEKVTQDKEVFEVLMVDRQGNVTEGSKSNLFLLKGNTLVTPPESTNHPV